MKNSFLSYFNKIVMIKITGRNINNILSRIYSQKIELLKVKIIDRHEVNIKIFLRDLPRIEKLKYNDEVEIIEHYGILKVKKQLKANKIVIFSLIFGYTVLIVLSNLIFNVQVIHSNKKIRDLLISELKDYNITKLKFKKSYDEIEKIENEILKKYRNKLEWIEIDEIGTSYIVKVEERKIIEKKEEYNYQDIVAAKNAVIIKIEANSGIVIKKKNDYVQKGDIIITGKIMNGEKLADIVKADGRIYGEVWYNIRIEFPLLYKERSLTGKKKTVYNLRFLNYKLSLFDLKPFKNKSGKEKVILANALIPFKLTKEIQNELKVIDEVYTEGEALVKAKELAQTKIESTLSDGEYVINKKALRYYQENQKIYLDMFFKVCEDITKASPITLIEGEQ